MDIKASKVNICLYNYIGRILYLVGRMNIVRKIIVIQIEKKFIDEI